MAGVGGGGGFGVCFTCRFLRCSLDCCVRCCWGWGKVLLNLEERSRWMMYYVHFSCFAKFTKIVKGCLFVVVGAGVRFVGTWKKRSI